jgi:1-acyl-sn-glycerol-3-phosphate acyltransferase
VKSWPLIGWLTRCAGTIFVNRTSKADVRRVSLEMNHALRDGGVLGFFPEGTSTDGCALSRFHAPLFSVCENGAAPVTPAFLRYALEDGEPEKDVCYWGDMTFLPHLLNLLTKRRILAGVIWGTPENCVENRKAVARHMFEQVSRLRSRASALGANITTPSFTTFVVEAGSTR